MIKIYSVDETNQNNHEKLEFSIQSDSFSNTTILTILKTLIKENTAHKEVVTIHIGSFD